VTAKPPAGEVLLGVVVSGGVVVTARGDSETAGPQVGEGTTGAVTVPEAEVGGEEDTDEDAAGEPLDTRKALN